jgi:hypothetical protein
MPLRKPPPGLVQKVERACATMRDTASRLNAIADQLADKTQADELRFLERLLLRESEALALAAASGDVASTSLAARLSRMGLTVTIGAATVFGTTIIEDAGHTAYDSLLGAHASATTNVQEVQLYAVEVGSTQVDGDLEALQSSMATFADTFVTSRGSVIFPSFLPEGALSIEQRMSDIQTMMSQMRDWLSSNQPEKSAPGHFVPGSRERVEAELQNATVQLQRISAMRQVLDEEAAATQRIYGDDSGTYGSGTYGSGPYGGTLGTGTPGSGSIGNPTSGG